jgi:acylphosphatase
MITKQYRITGRVQGVGFRYFTLKQARALGLSGTVKNEADGSVTVVARGEEEPLEVLEKQLREGPSFARVETVTITPSQQHVPEGFEVIG